MQIVVAAVIAALENTWRCPVMVHRGERVVSIADNYERLHYPPDAVTRDARYTRYVGATHMLRSHSTALVPGALRRIAAAPYADVAVACPGIVYRRDSIDRLHSGEPHQMDLWRISARPLGRAELDSMIGTVTATALPGCEVRLNSVRHPYTLDGQEIEVWHCGRWVEIGECGLASPHVLAEAGLTPEVYSGLAMGLGLDRVLMLRKGIDDIRLLRSVDPRVVGQMQDLAPYRTISSMPPVRRDLSVCIRAGTEIEEIGDRVRSALGTDQDWVEEISVLSRTPVDQLPDRARARLGASPGQENILLRLVLRPVDRTLTDTEANAVRDCIYLAIHEGAVMQLTGATL